MMHFILRPIEILLCIEQTTEKTKKLPSAIEVTLLSISCLFVLDHYLLCSGYTIIKPGRTLVRKAGEIPVKLVHNVENYTQKDCQCSI